MESLKTKEFLEKLKTNSLKPGLKLIGFVKKSDKDNEVQFASKHNFHHWVTIPAAMIESVTVLKNFAWGDNNYTLVKLNLQTPTTPESKTLYDLLAATHHDESHLHGLMGVGSKLMHKFWHGHGEGHCHCHNPNCHCHGHCNNPNCPCHHNEGAGSDKK
jgi:hypothetical protein